MAYDFKNSPLYLDVKKIIDEPSPLSKYIYKAKIHTEEEDIPTIKIISFNIIRDYVAAYSDYMYIEVSIPLGDYVYKIFPFRENLEISIKMEQILYPGQEHTYQEEGDTILRYKAVFDPGNEVPGSSLAELDIVTLNNADIKTLKFQLLEVCSVPIMISRVYGNHSKKEPESLLREIIGKGVTNIEIDGKAAISSIDIYPPDNLVKVSDLVVKDGMHLVEFPKYMQESSNGVYLRGLGSYYQYYNKEVRWFVYPLYDTTRFDKDERDKLIIYSIPNREFTGIDRTYMRDGNIISILVLDNYEYKDNSKANDLNYGGGFKMQASKTVMGRTTEIKNDKIKNSRTNTVNEVLFQERKDGLNYSRQIHSSNNPFKIYSDYNIRTKAEITVRWDHGDYELIYPGMPVKYVYYDGEDIVETFGNIAALDTSIVPSTPDLIAREYTVSLAMKLYIEPVEKLNSKKYEIDSYGDF